MSDTGFELYTETSSVPKKLGRKPTEFTERIANRICDGLSEGESLRAICGDEGMPSPSLVYRWLRDNATFRDNYARAREEQGETVADQMSFLRNQLALGLIAPDVARVMMDAIKWEAGKRLPKKYGDRQQVELSGDVAIKADPMALANLTDVQREQLRSIAASLAAKPPTDAD